ncbi:thioesterase family protein [Pseudoxanthobacter sp.]|uniref:acyl-CoA thioesterase n=1 Tax=Pseudoxanthobacter sp. TaxID=1925742 RepID=UPI002FE053BF
MTEERRRPVAGDFRFWSEDKVRFSDLDVLGHCNNVAVTRYFETARVEVLEAAGVRLTEGRLLPAVVRTTVTFHREMFYGATVRIGTRITRFGRTSMVLESALFDADNCAADAEVVLVMLDGESHRPIPVPDDLRTRLEAVT